MIYAPISVGDLIDRITILEIKAERIKIEEKITNIHKELDALKRCLMSLTAPIPEDLKNELKTTNEILWDIENEKRRHEATGDFGTSFIELARNVYRYNDKRAEIKRSINKLCHSEIVEEKYFNLQS